MKPNYYKLYFIILILLSSCANLNNSYNKTKKVDLSNNFSKESVNCPNYFIPEETRYLLNKKKEKTLKLRNVKLVCKIISENKTKKVLINQIVYYEFLKDKLTLNKSNSFVYLAIVDNRNNNIKNKILMKLNKKSLKKLGDKMYLKDTKTFKIEFNKNFIFYYGFQK